MATLPRQQTLDASTGRPWSLPRDNQFRDVLELGLGALVSPGAVNASIVTTPAGFTVRVPSGAKFYDKGVLVTLSANQDYSGATSPNEAVVTLWGKILRTAAVGTNPTALDTYTLDLTHTYNSTAPSTDHFPIARYATGAAAVSGAIDSEPSGKYVEFLMGQRQVIDGWIQDNVVASQSAVELTRAVGRFRAPRAGSLTAVIATVSEARTAGTLTVEVFKNTGLAGASGSGTGLTAVLNATNTSRKATTQAKDADTFAAGDELFVVVTTDAGWLPVTSDLRVAIEIET
jgi:hypothetical protein